MRSDYSSRRQLIEDYRVSVEAALVRFNEKNLTLAVKLARLPEQIRGFGHARGTLARLKSADARSTSNSATAMRSSPLGWLYEGCLRNAALCAASAALGRLRQPRRV
ncbi:MAG: DUF6537 domain-containing protein [Burkholderiales bacterium]